MIIWNGFFLAIVIEAPLAGKKFCKMILLKEITRDNFWDCIELSVARNKLIL
jgi:hypothetical protein